MSAYLKLEARFARISAVGGASAMLHWDASVMLPKKSHPVRAEQQAALAEIVHELISAPELADQLTQAEGEGEKLDSWQRANLREMRQRWKHERAVPPKLVGAMTRATIASEACWREARKEDDFARFAPYLEEVLRLVREVAAAKAQAFGCTPYDALLDSYDSGLQSTQIDEWFGDLGKFLPDFTARVIEKQARESIPLIPAGPFDIAKQNALGRFFMERLGFDFDSGRLDVSLHPFCGGVPGDVRLTTRYSEDNFTESFFGVLHETGHALYEMGLPEQWRIQPVGGARGMSAHESQSLLVEMQLSRGPDFLHYAAPVIREFLGVEGEAYTPENLARLVTRVKPGFIRTSADEVTYPSHVILRYRLEKALLLGELGVKDLPGAWNEGMKELLGLVPGTDSEGCLQDIHWPDGAFGYFPTYTIGAMIAAQLFDTAKQTLPDLATHIQKGEFYPLVSFLHEKVHSQASFLSTAELVQQGTGQPLSTETYKAHLKRRYLDG